MTEKNRSHVAITRCPSTEAYWQFAVPSESETVVGRSVELLSVGDSLLDTFGEFLTPIEVQLAITLFSSDLELAAIDSREARREERLDGVRQTVTNDAGVTSEEIRTAVLDRKESPFLGQIDFENRVKIRLEDGDVFADKTSHSRKYWLGEPKEEPPACGPLSLTMNTVPINPTPDYGNDGEPARVITFSVDLHSDIWFEENEIGEINRQYLAAFLQRIEETLPVQWVNRELSEYAPDVDLEALIY